MSNKVDSDDVKGWFTQHTLPWSDEISEVLEGEGVECVEDLKLLESDVIRNLFQNEKNIIKKKAELAFNELKKEEFAFQNCFAKKDPPPPTSKDDDEPVRETSTEESIKKEETNGNYVILACSKMSNDKDIANALEKFHTKYHVIATAATTTTQKHHPCSYKMNDEEETIQHTFREDNISFAKRANEDTDDEVEKKKKKIYEEKSTATTTKKATTAALRKDQLPLQFVVKHWCQTGHQTNQSRLAIIQALSAKFDKSDIARAIRSEVYGEPEPWNGLALGDSRYKKIYAVLVRVESAWKKGDLTFNSSSFNCSTFYELKSKSVKVGARGRKPLDKKKEEELEEKQTVQIMQKHRQEEEEQLDMQC